MANTPAQVCINRLIAFRLKEIFSHKESAFEGSVDGIHDMRVACRRLHALFKVFGAFYKKKDAGEFRRSLRELLRGLGAVREYDVLIGYIAGSVAPATRDQEVTLGLLIGRHSLRRSRAHRELRSLLRAIDTETHETLWAGRIPRIISPARHPLAFRSLLAETNRRLFARFIGAAPSAIDHPHRADALHRLRIQGKPLRYIMELSVPFFGTAFLSCYHEVKATIELLGDIHDIDVTLDKLKIYAGEIRFCNAAARRGPRRFAGIGSGGIRKAVRILRVRRHDLFLSLSATFARWRKNRIQATLTASMK